MVSPRKSQGPHAVHARPPKRALIDFEPGPKTLNRLRILERSKTSSLSAPYRSSARQVWSTVFERTCAECHGPMDPKVNILNGTFPSRRSVPIPSAGNPSPRPPRSLWRKLVCRLRRQTTHTRTGRIYAPPLDGLWLPLPTFITAVSLHFGTY